MDGIHDLGGMQGFAAVSYSPAEPVFRHRWEAVARALLVVAGAVEASAGVAARLVQRHSVPGPRRVSGREFWLRC